MEAANRLNLIKEHIGHVRHAIDPELLAEGPGLGFGLQRALAGERAKPADARAIAHGYLAIQLAALAPPAANGAET